MIEYNDEYNRELAEIVRQKPNKYGIYLKAKHHKYPNDHTSHRYLYDYVMDCTKDVMDEKYLFPIRLAWVLDKRQEFPKCRSCGREFRHPGAFEGFDSNAKPMWKRYCSSHCWHKDPEAIERMNHTLEKRYGKGVVNVFQVESIKEKSGDTKEERYGDRKYKNWDKIRKTCLEKYGAENIRKSEFGKRRIAETNLRKYGVKCASQSSEIRSKMHKTYDYSGQNFDTGWELAFYIWHKDHGIELVHEPEGLKYKDRNGKEHFYFPDFKIGETYYEIKGGQFFDEDGNPKDEYKDKFDFMRSIGVVLIRSKEIKPYLEYVSEKYGKDFLRSCKRK